MSYVHVPCKFGNTCFLFDVGICPELQIQLLVLLLFLLLDLLLFLLLNLLLDLEVLFVLLDLLCLGHLYFPSVLCPVLFHQNLKCDRLMHSQFPLKDQLEFHHN